MAEKNPPTRDFVEMLLEQDSPAREGRYRQHDDQIKQRLRKAARQEKSMRIATIVIWIGAFAFYPVMAIAQWLPDTGQPRAGFLIDVVMPIVGAALLSCQVLAVPALVWYVLRYRRALDRARADARDTTLMQLQETVTRLAARLPDVEENRADADP
jgi:fatty acid desaturase